MTGKPTTLKELFDFYHNYVKLLYSSVQARNQLPLEVLFELNAALDHISRFWVYNEPEHQVVEKAYSHLKRSCLDIFKLRVVEAIEQFEDLQQVDTSAIANGTFDAGLRKLVIEIKSGATAARKAEGDVRKDSESISSFDLWTSVFEKCAELEEKYYNHPAIDWSKRRVREKVSFSRHLFLCLISALLGGLVVWFLKR